MFRDSKDRPVWETLEVPKSSIETVDIICPNCKYHTAWKRGGDWFNCCMCFNYVGNGADKLSADAKVYRDELKLKRRSQY